MKNLFRLSLVAFASLFFFGCMSDSQGDPLTIVLPDNKVVSSFAYVDQPVPTGSVSVISSVQFIRNSDDNSNGTLVVATNTELDELYLYVDGKPGYYVISLSDKDIKTSDTSNPLDNKYVYSVPVESYPYLQNQEEVSVSGKTSNEDEISYGVPARDEEIKALACGTSKITGDYTGWIGNIDMKQKSGSFIFEYDTRNIPDRVMIYDGANNTNLRDTLFVYEGGTKGWKSQTVKFNKSMVTIEVTGLDPETYWDFKANCP